jgi:ATP-dependent DNA helicase DinG
VADFPYPALHASHSGIWVAHQGETRAVSRGEAIRIAADTPVVLMNAPVVGQRLGYGELSGLDVLELFAFLHPARFMVPTPKGLATVTGLPTPETDAEVAPFLLAATARLLATAEGEWPEREGAWTAAQSLARLRWPWTPLLRIPRPERNERWLFSKLPEWQEAAPRPAPRAVTLADADVLTRLDRLTGAGAEPRAGQRAYAQAAATTSCSRRRGPGSGRHWAISRPPASGPSARAAQCGCPPTPRRCNASSRTRPAASTPTRRSGAHGS